MPIEEAKKYIGKHCRVSWTDRLGDEHWQEFTVEKLQFVPLYGTYIVGDTAEVRLDKVLEIRALN